MSRSPSLWWRLTCTLLFLCAAGFALFLCVLLVIAITAIYASPEQNDFRFLLPGVIDGIVAFIAATVLAIGSYFMLLNAWFTPRYLLGAWGTILAGELIGLLTGLHSTVMGESFALFLPPLILVYVLQPRGAQPDPSFRL
jgi:hypothetical protein